MKRLAVYFTNPRQVEVRQEPALSSLGLGAEVCLEPASAVNQIEANFQRIADLTYELSGNLDAINQAIAVTSFYGRVVFGSWYGQKQANLDLGGYFHRRSIQLTSSQVSTPSPAMSGRWTKERRFDVVWRMLEKVKPSSFISHRFIVTEADKAYRLSMKTHLKSSRLY